MSDVNPASAAAGAAPRIRWDWPSASATATIFHCLAWTLIPALFIASLHPDTLQIIYWGHDFAFGYPKHPPLDSWVLNLILFPGAPPIFTVLLLGGVCVAITAGFIWATTRLFASRAIAAIAVLFYLASPVGSFFAIQVNHNSLLVPFWAATLFFALRYFERRKTADALLAGLISGLGALSKYEIFFLLAALTALCACERRYRPLLRSGATVSGGLLSLAILSPHLAWLVHNSDESLAYAIAERPMQGWSGQLSSLNGAFIGHLNLALGPLLGFVLLTATGMRVRANLSRWRLCLIVALGPSVALLIASLALHQMIRQGWPLPFTPGVALGAALALEVERRPPSWRWLGLTFALSLGQVALFYGLLWQRGGAGRPIAAYDLDSRGMAEQGQAFWTSRTRSRLACLIINDAFVAGAPVLWLPGRPQVVELDQPSSSTPARLRACTASGALAIKLEADRWRETVPLCPGNRQIRVNAPLGDPKAGWTVELGYVPPGGDLALCAGAQK